MVKEDKNTKRFKNIINRITSRFVKWSQCNREVLDLMICRKNYWRTLYSDARLSSEPIEYI
jgi:hypothetical protein